MNDTSSLLRIAHHTTYRYKTAVTFQPHRLVLRPREGHDLRVERHDLRLSPPCDLLWSRDIFGNSVAHAYFSEPAAELRIVNELLIQRFPPTSPPSPMTTPGAYPVQYDTLEQTAVAPYLAPVYPDDIAAVQNWLRTRHPLSTTSADELLLTLTTAIHQAIKYQRREERGVQSPGTTLTLGTGSCRDVATLLMECARHLGIAARFASGYLDCVATRAARGVTHAWTEVYFPHLGWRGYDPTTGKPCTHQHIVIGVSNHPRGVMPVSGKYLGGDALLDMNVTVEFSPVTP